MRLDKTEIIKNFVVNKLGCNCPPEVFNVIKSQNDIQINDGIILDYKINIGNRLLIYIIGIEDANYLANNLLNIIRLGISERNENNFNRLRLVISSNNISEIGSIVQDVFKNLNINDEKVHLHVIPKTDIVLQVRN